MRAKLANLNDCSVPFLSRAAANLPWYCHITLTGNQVFDYRTTKGTFFHFQSDSTDSKCVVQAPLPKCEQAPWTRVNHLGNSIDSKGNASRWEAELPYFPSGAPKRCVLRLR